MPSTYKVLLTDRALSQLREIAQFILQDSPQSALEVATAILTTIDSLAEFPARFKRVGTSRKLKTPIHAAGASGFIIYFSLDSERLAIHVITILRGAQRQPQTFG